MEPPVLLVNTWRRRNLRDNFEPIFRESRLLKDTTGDRTQDLAIQSRNDTIPVVFFMFFGLFVVFFVFFVSVCERVRLCA